MKKLLIGLVMVVVVVVAAAGGWVMMLDSRARAPGEEAGEVELEIPRGATGRSVGTQLVKAGLIEDALTFRYVLWSRGRLSLKAGKSAKVQGLIKGL